MTMPTNPTLLDSIRPGHELFRWGQDRLDHHDPQPAQVILEGLLARVRQSDPASVSAVRAELVRAYFHTARLQAAEELAREAVAADPTDAPMGVLLARILQRRSRHAEVAVMLPRLEAMLGPDDEGVTILRERAR